MFSFLPTFALGPILLAVIDSSVPLLVGLIGVGRFSDLCESALQAMAKVRLLAIAMPILNRARFSYAGRGCIMLKRILEAMGALLEDAPVFNRLIDQMKDWGATQQAA